MGELIIASPSYSWAKCCGAHYLPWLSLLLVLAAPPVWSDTVISGTVSNVLRQQVAGARIAISHQGQPLQEGVTDRQGGFGLEIDFGNVGNLDLVVTHPDYEPNHIAVHIADFEPTAAPYSITLMPSELSHCAGVPGAIVVGKFLPPLSALDADLTGHVHRVLSFRILPRLQAEELREQLDDEHQDLVPQFLKCEGAVPRTEAQGKIMAEALGGQGLVWGLVADANTGFDINASVADAGTMFDPPFTTTSHEVDLGHPTEAVISPMMRTAVLLGVMATLEHASQYQAAIHVSNVVRTLIPEASISGAAADADWQLLNEAAEEIRRRCQQSIPHAGLLGGSP
jgi:hypothetical protein